jgi:hypothetical protein
MVSFLQVFQQKSLYAQIISVSMYGLNMRLKYSRLMIRGLMTEEVMKYEVNDTGH